jgi:SAM-dependent methyltransferase
VDKDKIKAQIDLEWDDNEVVPEVVNPDIEFLFNRMTEATFETVAARDGEMILDIGCGRAGDGVELAKRGAMVVGLEASRVMLAHAREHINGNGAHVTLVHGVSEYLPFRPQSVDKVLCKGALDHFVEPDAVIGQIARVLKPEGQAIIALANFESLGFKLGRRVYALKSALGFKDGVARMPWEPPPDHTCKFDYFLLKRMVDNHLKVEEEVGVSFLFGFPWWGPFLARCPRKVYSAILALLDKMARRFPSLSDVVILRCRPKNGECTS